MREVERARLPTGKAPARLAELLEQLEAPGALPPQVALTLSLEAAAIARAAGDDAALARALWRAGNARHARAQYPAALAAYLEAVALAPPDDLELQGEVWRGAAHSQVQMANYREALEYLEITLRLARRARRPEREVAALDDIARVQGDLGERGRAAVTLEASLELRRGVGDARGLARGHLDVGIAKLGAAKGAPDPDLCAQAARSLQRAVTRARRLGDARLLADALAHLALARLALGQFARAARSAGEARGVARNLSDPLLEARALHALGGARLAQGKASALELLGAALQLARRVGARELAAELHLTLSRAHEAQGRFGEALAHHKRFHDLALTLRGEAGEERARAVAARLDVQRSRFEADSARERSAELEDLVRERTAQLAALRTETIELLAGAAEFRDAPLAPHIRWVGEAAGLVARELGLPQGEADDIALAARLHDIGKIGIPDGILLKEGALDAAEWAVMRTHTALGAGILARGESPLLHLAGQIASTHHERWDGGGYPRGLKGSAIPLAGRVVSVVDAYDALLSERPYKSAWTGGAALAHLRGEAGSTFDPAVVNAFARLAVRGELPPRES